MRYLLIAKLNETAKDFKDARCCIDTYNETVMISDFFGKFKDGNVCSYKGEVKGRKIQYLYPVNCNMNALTPRIVTREQIMCLIEQYPHKTYIQKVYKPIYNQSLTNLTAFSSKMWGEINNEIFHIKPHIDFKVDYPYDCRQYFLVTPKNIKSMEPKHFEIRPDSCYKDINKLKDGSTSTNKAEYPNIEQYLKTESYDYIIPQGDVSFEYVNSAILEKHTINKIEAQKVILEVDCYSSNTIDENNHAQIKVNNLKTRKLIIKNLQAYKFPCDFEIDTLDLTGLKDDETCLIECANNVKITINNIVGDTSKLLTNTLMNINLPKGQATNKGKNIFEGKKFILSGKLSEFDSKAVCENKILKLKGIIVSTVKQADILICDGEFNNGGTSSKLKMATQLGIKIMSSKEFNDLAKAIVV